MVTVGDVGEAALLARLRARVPPPGADVPVGIGDDAAVLMPPRGALLVQTTDALVEHVHFERRLVAAGDIGRRAVAVNLSDLAAMGARPSWLLLSLVLPLACPLDDFDALVDGVVLEGRRWGAVLVGGNLTAAPDGGLVVDVTATGSVRARRVLRRDTARAGDELWLTGAVGAAAAGLQMLSRDPAAASPCVDRYRVPTPRLREAWALAATRAARAAIDLSDGLAVAVGQLAEASRLGARIDAGAVPVDPTARAWFDAQSVDAVGAAIGASDDYELLVAVKPSSARRLQAIRARTATPLTRIGVLTRDAGCRLVTREGEVDLPGGFEHFTTR